MISWGVLGGRWHAIDTRNEHQTGPTTECGEQLPSTTTLRESVRGITGVTCAATQLAAAETLLLLPATPRPQERRFGRRSCPRFLPGGRPVPPPPHEVTSTISIPAPRPALCDIPLLDAEGAPIPHGSEVEQITGDETLGALRCRLYRRGEVIGRSRELVYVVFVGERDMIGLRPQLVRLVAEHSSTPKVTTVVSEGGTP